MEYINKKSRIYDYGFQNTRKSIQNTYIFIKVQCDYCSTEKQHVLFCTNFLKFSVKLVQLIFLLLLRWFSLRRYLYRFLMQLIVEKVASHAQIEPNMIHSFMAKYLSSVCFCFTHSFNAKLVSRKDVLNLSKIVL